MLRCGAHFNCKLHPLKGIFAMYLPWHFSRSSPWLSKTCLTFKISWDGDSCGKPLKKGAQHRFENAKMPRPRCQVTTITVSPMKRLLHCGGVLGFTPDHITSHHPMYRWPPIVPESRDKPRLEKIYVQSVCLRPVTRPFFVAGVRVFVLPLAFWSTGFI